MNAKLLTLVIPTYNMEKYIAKCLSSLLVGDEQMSLFEVLVIIDGSKDHSSEIAHTFQNKWPNIFRVIDKENGNYGSCVNRGVAEATGKYIKVLDADDYFDTTQFREYLSKLSEVNVDLVLTPYTRVDETGKTVSVCEFELRTGCNMPTSELDSLKNIEMHGFTYRTDLLRSFGYKQTEGISYTDTEWILIPLPYVKTVCHIDNNIYRYLVGRAGQTVDERVLLKNYTQLTQVNLSVFKSIASLSEEKVRGIIATKILLGLNLLYKTVLCSGGGSDMTNLIAFDKKLKLISPAFYRKSNDLVLDQRVPYPYLKIWRESYNCKNLNKSEIIKYKLLMKYRVFKTHFLHK